MNRIKILLAILTLCIVLGIIIFFVKNPFCYNSDYWGDVGIVGNHLYSNVINQKGTPEKIIYVDNETFVVYDNMQFVWYTDLKGIFIRVDIIDNTVLIGNKNLCIGRDKNDVIKAYGSIFIKPIKDLPPNCIGYIDNRVNIIYYFDQQDKVEKISISIY